MFRRISKAERERRAARAELETTVQALHANERAFKEARDPFYIEQLTYQPPPCCAAGGHCCAYCARRPGEPMTEYWPFLAAGICVLAVVRCAARQRHGVRSLLAGLSAG